MGGEELPYNLTNYTDRQSQYPNRRKLKNIITNEETEYDVYRDEGTITKEGTPWNAATLNALDKKISNQFQSGTFSDSVTLYYCDDIVDNQIKNAPHIVNYEAGSGYNLYKYATYQIVNDLAYVNIYISGFHFTLPTGFDETKNFALLGPLPEAISYRINDSRVGSVFGEFLASGMGESTLIRSREPISFYLSSGNNYDRRYFKLAYNRGSSLIPLVNLRSQRIDLLLSFTYKFR